jgi:hypothetical protein
MVKYLTTSEGVKHPFCISYSALSMWTSESGKSFDEISENMNVTELEPLFYYSMLAGARQTKERFPNYDRKGDEYLVLIDELWFPFMKAMPDFFQEGFPEEK